MASKKEDNNIYHAIKGGQQVSHNLEMLKVTLKRHSKFIGAVFGLSSIASTHFLLDDVALKYTLYKGFAHFNQFIFNGQTVIDLNVGVDSYGRDKIVQVTWDWIANNPQITDYALSAFDSVKQGLLIGSAVTALYAILHTRYVIKKGKKTVEDEHVKGSFLSEKDELLEAVDDLTRELNLKYGAKSMFELCGVPLPPAAENSGILTIGSPGVGKSTTYRDLLSQLRKQGHKAIIYDVGGEFTQKFYREGIDHILNPFDERSASWDVWSEGRSELIYSNIVDTIFPMPKSGDPFWTLAPRIVLRTIMKILGNRYSSPDIMHLCNIVMRMKADKISGFLRGSDASNIFNVDVEKLAGSIQSIMATSMQPFKYLNQRHERFSIRKWVNDESDDSWIFITCKEEHRTLLSPLITIWIEIAAKSILSLRPNRDRRIGVLVDEFPTLNPIPSLSNLLSLGRKYGAVPVLGAQNPAQIVHKYGEAQADVLLDSMACRMIFRCNGHKGARWGSQELGRAVKNIANQSVTIGQADSRDSTSVSNNRNTDELILASEIQALPDSVCYLSLGKGLPVCKLDITERDYPDEAEPIIEIDIEKLEKERDSSIQRVVHKKTEGANENPESSEDGDAFLESMLDSDLDTEIQTNLIKEMGELPTQAEQEKIKEASNVVPSKDKETPSKTFDFTSNL